MGLVRKMFIDHSGTGHKWAHNVTTVMNIPLFAWLVYAVFALRGTDFDGFVAFVSQPLHLAASLAFVVVTLTHFTLELEVVFEDYISNLSVRKAAITALKVFWSLLGLASIGALLTLVF